MAESMAKGAPWITWVSGAAALLALGSTAWILTRHEPAAQASSPSAPAEPNQTSSSSSKAAAPPLPKNPLDIASWLVDAEQRARIWHENAGLLGIQVIIEDGAPLGALEITFGQTAGRPLPDSPSLSRRLKLTYEKDEATEQHVTDASPARVVTLPNCPLEAAFRAATQVSGSRAGRVLAVYGSRSHRPVWSMTLADGTTRLLDGSSCAVLVR